MHHGKIVAGLATLSLVGGGTGVALAARGSAPKRANIAAVQTLKVKINRYVQDGLRWKKDVYQVRSGGTLRIVNNAPDEGPHTFTVLKKSDLPKTPRAHLQLQICNKLGAGPRGRPEQRGAAEVPVPRERRRLDDRRRTSTGPATPASSTPKKGASVTLKVTAKKGTTLHFICLIHPWMQAKVVVQLAAALRRRALVACLALAGALASPDRRPGRRARASTTGSPPCRRRGTSCPTGTTRSWACRSTRSTRSSRRSSTAASRAHWRRAAGQRAARQRRRPADPRAADPRARRRPPARSTSRTSTRCAATRTRCTSTACTTRRAPTAPTCPGSPARDADVKFGQTWTYRLTAGERLRRACGPTTTTRRR